MDEKIHLTTCIPETEAGKRLDAVCKSLFPAYSRARLQTWIKTGQLLVDQAQLRPRDLVKGGETIVIDAELIKTTSWEPQPLNLDIVYEDDDLLVLNKPAGLVVHPAAGNLDNTLLNGLAAYCPSLLTLPRCGIIHRLDKDTTGLMIVAKSLPAHAALVKALADRSIKRQYAAVVNGIFSAGDTIRAPIGRHSRNRLKMAVTASGKPAVTHFRLRQRFSAHTYVEVQLETGRTHQIRVHMAHIRHPLVGDSLYGGHVHIPKNSSALCQETLRHFPRQALHAEQLGFTHPLSGENMLFTAPLPEDLRNLIAILTAN